VVPGLIAAVAELMMSRSSITPYQLVPDAEQTPDPTHPVHTAEVGRSLIGNAGAESLLGPPARPTVRRRPSTDAPSSAATTEAPRIPIFAASASAASS
jgi:hypothetical protein